MPRVRVLPVGRRGRPSDGPGGLAGAVAVPARPHRLARSLLRPGPLLALALSVGGWAAAEDWIGVPLTGAPMVSTLVENYLVGRPQSAPAFVLRFTPDGSVVFVNERAGLIRGSWQVVGDRVCIQWTDAPLPACQQPWLDGDRLTFTDAEGHTIAVARLSHEPPDWAAGLLD